MPEMEFWEFLLQKEGDRSWLPLESPDVEILEGRYRVVARSHRKNANIEVRITHQATEEIPPKRRTQKRPNRTNADGLMVVIPFTSLKPGTWELNCSGDLMADLLGNSWQASVQLHVVPHEADSDQWDPDWQPASEAEDPVADDPVVAPLDAAIASSSEAETPLEAEMLAPEETLTEPVSATANANSAVDRLRQITEQMSESSAELASQTLEVAPEATAAIVLPPLQITLTQETYIAHRDQTLTISGRVAPVDEKIQNVPSLTNAELTVCLRDPQTSEVLLETCELILNQPLPMPLAFDLMLPTELNSRLLLGEVKLNDLTEQSETPSVLANQLFTLSAAADELLEAVASHLVTDEDALERLTSPPEPMNADSQTAASPLSSAFLDLVDTAKTPQAPTFKPTGDRSLPPQIYQPTPDQEGKKSLDLPSFAAPARDEVPDPEATIAPDPAAAAIEQDSLQLEPAANPDTQASEELPPDQLPAIAPAKVSPVQSAFQALKLQDRFFSRLNSLATDAELSEALRVIAVEQPASPSEAEPVEEASATEPETSAEPEVPAPLIEPETDFLTQEIVVDDEPKEAVRPVQDSSAPNPLLLAADEPVPTPVLEIAAEELVAGRSLMIRAKLPNLLPKIYVKLWINDRQTRALLDGPHWLIDFTPNGLGDLESLTQLVVPFGSLEIQLEAIAIEVSTQRESHKVVVDRAVIPPDLPDLSLNEFDA